MEPENRGYWDEYTDVMKDSYGIGHDFAGYFAYMNKMFDLALWCFDNALRYRQPQTLSRIYLMQGETRMALGDYTNAVNSYQECLRREPRNPYAFAKIGDAFRLMNDPSDAEQAYRQSLAMTDPQHPQKEAVDGLQLLAHAATLGPGASR
jgi:cytochrome c-type biogenesis protein CcmH/NrfG